MNEALKKEFDALVYSKRLRIDGGEYEAMRNQIRVEAAERDVVDEWSKADGGHVLLLSEVIVVCPDFADFAAMTRKELKAVMKVAGSESSSAIRVSARCLAAITWRSLKGLP